MSSAATVFVVDDDRAVLKALARLLHAEGFAVQAFASPQAFLEQHDPASPGCLVLDVRMPGLNGLELQQSLAASGAERYIVFITGEGDIPTSVRAMKAGAVNFLAKPFNDSDLLAAVGEAVEKDSLARHARAELQSITKRLACLTPREREILEHVAAGRLNKQIAADLGTVEKTVKVHRARVMEKMGANSLASLVRMAERLGIKSHDEHPSG
jgi:FixJ family two-component response regulator